MQSVIIFVLTAVLQLFYGGLSRGDMPSLEEFQGIYVNDVHLQFSVNLNERSNYIDRELKRFNYPLEDTDILPNGKHYQARNRHTYFNDTYVIDYFVTDDDQDTITEIENTIKELNLNE